MLGFAEPSYLFLDTKGARTVRGDCERPRYLYLSVWVFANASNNFSGVRADNAGAPPACISDCSTLPLRWGSFSNVSDRWPKIATPVLDVCLFNLLPAACCILLRRSMNASQAFRAFSAQNSVGLIIVLLVASWVSYSLWKTILYVTTECPKCQPLATRFRVTLRRQGGSRWGRIEFWRKWWQRPSGWTTSTPILRATMAQS